MHAPSGPRLFPVPSVAVAAKAFFMNLTKSFRSEIGGSFVQASISSGGLAPVSLIESRSTSFTVSRSPGGKSPPALRSPPTASAPSTGIALSGSISSTGLNDSGRDEPSP